MKIVLASDLDGTLVIDNIVPQHNVKSLENLNNAGGIFIISTGRPFNGVSYLIDEYKLNVNYKILLNGALILDNLNNPIIHKTISFSYVEEIISYVKKFNPGISLETGFKSYVLERDHFDIPYSGKVIVDTIDNIDDKEISLISLFFDKLNVNEIDNIILIVCIFLCIQIQIQQY